MEPLSLKKHRLLAGLSQKEVAARLNVSQPTYQRWESGTVSLPEVKRKKLAQLLGLAPGELVAAPGAFDELGISTAGRDERRHYGEVAVHFTGGGPSLLLSVSLSEYDALNAQLVDGFDFLVVTSLDNRTVVLRAAAIADLYFSSTACADQGPAASYTPGLGIFADGDFWEIVETLACAGAEYDTQDERIVEALDTIMLTDAQLDALVQAGTVAPADRAAARAAADARTQRFYQQATDVRWQLAGGTLRTAYVSEDEDIHSVILQAQNADEDLSPLLYLNAEGLHRSVYINPRAIDYIAAPTHRYLRGKSAHDKSAVLAPADAGFATLDE